MAACNQLTPGFHFQVVFELYAQPPVDARFQDVDGLDAMMDMGFYREGDQQGARPLCVRTQYATIILKRGLFFNPEMMMWCRQAMDGLVFKPVNILISLLNSEHLPLNSWYVVNAIPKKWQVSNFSQIENSLMIETLTLNCQYFYILTPDAAANNARGSLETDDQLAGSMGLSL